MNLWERQLSLTPLGGQTLSKLPARYVEGVYPKLLSHGKGGHVWDVDGKEYIDLISGLGAVSVGYNNDYVNRAVINQLEKGVSFSLPTTIEADVAEKLCEVFPGTEMWKYGKNGVDATLMAIRCARAYTGRSKILVHGYHGCSDHFEAHGTRKAGMIDMSEYSHDRIKIPDELYAAVIIESYVFDRPEWYEIQVYCKKTGALLIVDEIVSGGRFPEFSAYKHLGLEPDLVTVGKGLANGFPLSAVGGRSEIMKTFERDDFFASTTFGGEAVSLAAALVTIDILQHNIVNVVAKGQQIKDAFNKEFASKGECKGFPTRLTFDFKRTEDKALFMQEMCKRGVLIGYSNMVMVDHTESDIQQICDAIRNVADSWINLELEGDLPVEALRLRNR